MTIPSVLLVLASLTSGAAVQTAKSVTNPPSTQPPLRDVPRATNGLTLYNSKGELVARCDKKDDSFSDCRMEPGMTLDDLMNAWVHAYQVSLKQN